MAILTATDIGHSFGANDLFSGINLRLAKKDRVGLVGPNGIGKTTLLLILSGLMEPTTGSVQHADVLTLGYLRQEAVLTFAGQDNTIYEEMLTVFASLQEAETQLRQMEVAMAGGEQSEALFAEYGRLQDQYDMGGGYTYQTDIKHVLMGLGFPQEEWNTPLAHLSGGQKTRVLLGRLLLEKPDLLILDEPTNHLDVAAIEWLEQTLRRWDGALIIVSHDRYFLDKIVNQIWEMLPTEMRTYRGNYSSYVQQRQLAWEREQELFAAEKARMESELDFIRRNIAGSKSDIAKGKLKRLTRDIVLMEQVGVMARQGKSWMELGGRVRTISANEAAQRIRALKSPSARPPKLNIRLQVEQRSGRTILSTKKLQIGYPDTPLFTTDDIRLERYDCVALIGPNGSGKTTFLRTLLGELAPLAGEIHLGKNLIMGYFAQAHDQLNLDNRVIDELRAHDSISEPDARHYLAQYLFRGDDVFKEVGSLSGGERGRLALAILARSGANVLLLDEPTNHLDIPSQEVLQEVLEAFDGTIVLVTHDRYLVDRLATQIWALRDGHLHIFKGTYQEYLEARDGAGEKAQEAKPAKTEAELQAEIAPLPPPEVKMDWMWEDAMVAPPLDLSKKEARQRARRLVTLQEEIDDTEAWLDQLKYDLEKAYETGNEGLIAEMEEEYTAVKADLKTLNAEWDKLVGE